jgi:tetratricopeptide (TPR) repeat protein
MTSAIDFKYRAFLSYSHADTPLAQWLHPRLERFPLRDLAGRATPLGPVPRALRPIFRDRDDFSAGGSLNEQTLAALDASAALIVLCSPAAAKSHYVNEEIRLFKQRCPGRPIVPVIAAGKPGGGDEECFPPALRFVLDAAGQVSDRPAEMPLAADVREEGDGRDLALAKMVAALIGVPSDEVYRRAERERKRQARIRNAVAAVIVLLASASAAFVYLSRQRGAALIDTAAACGRYLPKDQADAAGPLNALDQCVKTLEAMQKGAANDPRDAEILSLIEQGKKGEAERLQVEAARDDEAAGLARNKKAAERYRGIAATAGLADSKKAREYYARAAKLDPDNVDAVLWHGAMEQEAGDIAEAERAYNAVLGAGVIGQHDHDLYWARVGLGDIHKIRGNLSDALATHREAIADADRLANADPANANWQRDLAVSYSRVGNVLLAQGAGVQALKAYRDSLVIHEKLAKTHPGNSELRRDLWVSHNKLGEILRAQGELSAARQEYVAARVIAIQLTILDANNPRWQRDLSISYNLIGDLLVSQGALADALEAYRGGFAIFERLATADPASVARQHDLSVSYNKLGDVLAVLGSMADASQAYRKGLAIFERLARADPANARWQRDLSVSHNKVGYVLKVQGSLADALQSFSNGLAIREGLARADPTNAEWQCDLSESYHRMGDVLVSQGMLADALQAYRNGLAIRERLVKAVPANSQWQEDLAISYDDIGDVLEKQGDLEGALVNLKTGNAIFQMLAKSHESNMIWQQGRSISHAKLAELYLQLRETGKAREEFAQGREIMARLNKISPDWAEWRRDLAWFEAKIATLEEISNYEKASADVRAAFEAGDFTKAAAMQTQLAEALEKTETERAGAPGLIAADQQGVVSWYLLFTREFDKALAASERGLKFKPDRLWIASNKAYALMFLDRTNEARAVHLEHKGKQLGREETWDEVVLKDFDELEKRGLKHPQMAEVRRLLAPTAAPAR